MNALISIIIPFFDQIHYTKQCLESVLKNTSENYEIIMIDNGSSPETRNWLREQKFNIRLVVNETNLGAPKAFNQGIAVANGEFYLFLNNDTIVTKNWLKQLLVVLEANPEIAIVGPWLNHFHDKEGGFPNEPGYRNVSEINRTAAFSYLSRKGQLKDVKCITSTSMLIRKKIIDKVGSFDEHYGYGTNDDHDLCLRVVQAGYRIVCAMDTFVFHFGSRTLGHLDMNNLDRKNREYFVKKFGTDAIEYLENIKQPYGSRGEKDLNDL